MDDKYLDPVQKKEEAIHAEAFPEARSFGGRGETCRARPETERADHGREQQT
jgi:hypothetical protein